MQTTRWRIGVRWPLCPLAWALAGLVWMGPLGCEPPTPAEAVINADTGVAIGLDLIDPILLNQNTTQDQKRTALLDLGVPPDVVETLIASAG